jgi:hypothetical protein
VNRVDGAVIEEFSVIGFGALDAVGGGEALCGFQPAPGDCSDIHDAETPDCFEVNASHESCANDGCA